MKAGTFAGFPFVACTYTTVHLHERLQYIFSVSHVYRFTHTFKTIRETLSTHRNYPKNSSSKNAKNGSLLIFVNQVFTDVYQLN